ncbi:MAG: hypothetical protein Q4F67_00815 [Propionibacteriaceae bacterium]|nr:hypothetical protein [Propionibacteriaceae bacterium]
MAEVRKVTPGRGGHIAQAIEKAMGESVRPNTPGAPPDPSRGRAVPPAPAAPLTASTFLTSAAFLVPAEPEPETKDTGEESRA